jgi:prepilin-type processing-associated H-X9-DG protein
VAILGLLISILLPSLSSARSQAKAAVCGSNLRQIALANDLYAGDHGQSYCPGAANFTTANLCRWHGSRDHPSKPFDGGRGPLVPYLGPDARIRACPAFKVDLPDDDPRRFEKNCGGYGYNLAFVGRRLSKLDSGGYRLDSDLLGAQTHRVRNPAATIMFADSAFANGVLIEYSFTEPRRFPTFGTRPDPSIHFRHDGRANVVWCDGHVDRHRRTFTYRSGFYPGDPGLLNLGWFGQRDDNSLFDLD